MNGADAGGLDLREEIPSIKEETCNNGQPQQNIYNPIVGSEHQENRLIAFCGSEEAFLMTLPQQTTHQVAPDDFYGLGEDVKRGVFQTFKIKQLHQWQSDMLTKHISDKSGQKNALILAPTSGGKTMVAVILMLRSMLLDQKDCVFVLPYVALVSEKVHELKQLASNVPMFTVSEYAGSKGFFPIPRRKSSLRTLYVCTPEKGTVIWKCLCEDGQRNEEVGLVAVDECHMIKEPARGAVIEGLIVSVLHWSSPSTKILALSATVGNPNAARTFLGGGSPSRCQIFNVTSRPTNLKENLIVSGVGIPIRRKNDGLGTVCFSEKSPDLLQEGQDDMILESENIPKFEDKVIAKLVLESVAKGNSVLVFCNTRKNCVAVCEMLTKACQHLEIDNDHHEADNKSYYKEVKKQRDIAIGHLTSESKGMVNSSLLAGISAGVAFHSGQLHPIERKTVEDAFRRNIVSVLCCTTTLAAGVNLPATRVIIRSPWNGKVFVSSAQYLQMIGRAGRTNASVRQTQADSYILVQPNDVGRFQTLVESPVEDLKSQLPQDCTFYQTGPLSAVGPQDRFSGITRLIINSLCTSRRTMQLSELTDLCKLTLLYQSGEKLSPESPDLVFTIVPFLKQLKELVTKGYIQLVTPHSRQVDDFLLVVKSSHFHAGPQQNHDEVANPTEDSNEVLSSEVHQVFLDILGKAMESDSLMITDHFMRLSPIAAASSAGAMSISDAEHFVREAEIFEVNMPLQNPLAFLYLSITEGMSKPLIQDSQYHEHENSINTRNVNRMIAREFIKHPDACVMMRIGLRENKLEEWVLGNPSVRNCSKFNGILRRLWSALFLKELLKNMDRFEELCLAYGFDRTSALELSASMASRCQNLKSLCLSLAKFWWYPALANSMMKCLGQACEEEIRPLLALQHMTNERARKMVKMGIHSIQDVAKIFPPTLLSDNIPHLSIWTAVEMIMNARMLVAQEASLYEAESLERRKLLKYI